eukprot:TRINITY_DN2082_c0_g2_i1.p1 TRINITY_DN2082_c0_g2~~TRINITY_DN2082_c0_g2_i1.p1  ORF type:complete len:218 (+),score=28.25 TRINITY_DN2082_c0_g2_i1:53-655(+)
MEQQVTPLTITPNHESINPPIIIDLTQDEDQDNGWTCLCCTMINTGGVMCTICGSVKNLVGPVTNGNKGNDNRGDVDISDVVDGGSWSCERCSLLNCGSVCTMCGYVKGSLATANDSVNSSIGNVVGGMSIVGEGPQWSCKHCTMLNIGRICVMCNRVNDGVHINDVTERVVVKDEVIDNGVRFGKDFLMDSVCCDNVCC